MLEPFSCPSQIREQVLLGPDLHVAAVGPELPLWLGVEHGRCVGMSATELVLQLEAAVRAHGLTNEFTSALARVRDERGCQRTSPVSAQLGATACQLRIVLTPLSNAAGERQSIALAVEDVGPQLALERELVEASEQHQQALGTLRTELMAQSDNRAEELEHANAELLRVIAEHMKTENALRTTQEQLHHAQRLEAVGRLAGGIAHDFNNLLSIVLGYSLTIMGELPTDSPLRADVEEIRRAGERAAELTRQLLAFGRQQVLEPRVIDLNEVLLRMDRMVRRILGEDVEIITLPSTQLWTTRLDPGQIEQVIVNLVINARDAMPNGGTLTMETSNQHFDHDYAAAHVGAAPGPHVILAVSDTGTGMTKETQARVFEPFFTTKEKGKGTGLGLSTVFGIVKQSGGHIWLYSEPGEGTTFKLCFPRSSDAIDRASLQAPGQLSVAPRGSETILLVEDDTQLRTLARLILLRQGYQVVTAADGVEALQLSADFAGEISLLLTDVVMPHMNGRELARKLVAMRPHTKVLYMSGYTDNAIVHNGILDAGVAFLQKPITPDTLARRVRHVLDSPATCY